MSTARPGAGSTTPPKIRRKPKAGAGIFIRKNWHPVAFVIIALVAWWAVTETGIVPAYLIPSPSATWKAFAQNVPYYMLHTGITTIETIAGFLIATVVGLAVAVAMIYSPAFERTVYPLVLGAQVIPKIAIAPLFVVWLGFGLAPKITVAVLMAFFPVVIAGLAGLKSVDPEILELTSTMGAGKWRTFRKVRFPASLPQLFSGLKIAATLAVTGAVVGEFVGSNQGLGYVILQANGNLNTASVFVALIIMSLLGIAMFSVIQLVEKLTIPWHVSHRGISSTTV